MIKPYYEAHGCTIYHGDALAVLRALPSESVQCCVTSPPYDNLRTYGGFEWDFEEIAHELYRVLVDGGIVCWNVGDSVVDGSETLTSFKQAIYFKESVGFRVHDTMIYEKVNASRPNPARYNQCFEYVFVLSKGVPKCFNPIIDKRNVTFGKPCYGVHTMREKDGSLSVRKERRKAAEFGMRSNVWCGLTAGQENPCQPIEHPAVMPLWLAGDLVLSWSKPGDIVLDPFSGSGTTGEVAIKYGRQYIGIELNAEYIDLSVKRLAGVISQPLLVTL
jgi:site-specific DNA-methyltransferase (adenine-specific)